MASRYLMLSSAAFCALLALSAAQSATPDCSLATSCDTCIRLHQSCSWCSDLGVTTRCGQYSSFKASCNDITYPLSSTPNPTVNLAAGGSTDVAVNLRSGQSVTFNVTVTRGDYAVDLYYLLDESGSVSFIIPALVNQTENIGNELKKLTPRIRLGLGVFSDKPLAPFFLLKSDGTTLFQESIINNEVRCGFQNQKKDEGYKTDCGNPSSFRHILKLTDNTTQFIEAVNAIKVVKQQEGDPPRSSFDGLMQAVVCEELLGWSTFQTGSSIRLVILTSDEAAHFSGDGVLSGLFETIDDACYVDPATGIYQRQSTHDFPSAGQVKAALEKQQTIAIFAATTRPADDTKSSEKSFQNLANSWGGNIALVAALKRDNNTALSNVITTSTRLASERAALILRNGPGNQDQLSGVDFSAVAYCPTPNSLVNTSNVQGCIHMTDGRKATFAVTLTGRNCTALQNTQHLQLYFNPGYGIVNIRVNPICACNCTTQPKEQSTACDGGNLTCGLCQCAAGRTGRACQCETSTVLNASSPEKHCRHPQASTSRDLVCSGRGICSINKTCLFSCDPCNQGFHGGFCQCDSNLCPLDNGQPCGGSARGSCLCRTQSASSCGDCGCVCNSGFEINLLTKSCCPISNDGCQERSTSQVCSGNGRCRCRTCQCFPNTGWKGTYCDTCVTEAGECQRLCDRALPCLTAPPECINNRCCFCTGNKKVQQTEEGQCPAGCSDIICAPRQLLSATVTGGTYSAQISAGSNETVEHTRCPVTEGDCTVTYYVAENPQNTVQLLPIAVDPERVCSSSFDYLPVVLGIVFGLLGFTILVLVIFKVVIHILDAREYNQFVKNQKTAKWEQGSNPIFKTPKQTVLNPTYKGVRGE